MSRQNLAVIVKWSVKCLKAKNVRNEWEITGSNKLLLNLLLSSSQAFLCSYVAYL